MGNLSSYHEKPPYQISKLNPALSNVMYFILFIYSWTLAIKFYVSKNKGRTLIGNLTVIDFIATLLLLFGFLSVLSGCLSIWYHTETPHFEDDPFATEEPEYEDAFNADQGSALTYGIFSLVVIFLYLIWSCWRFNNVKDKLNLFLDINFWVALIFLIFAGISYSLAGYFWIRSEQHCPPNVDMCDPEKLILFRNESRAYNVYHSFWHVFSGFAGFFWVILVMTTFKEHLLLKRVRV